MKNFAIAICAVMLLAGSAAPLALAQNESPATPADPCKNPTYRVCPQNLPERSFYLNSSINTQYQAANDLTAALRNMLPPEAKVYLVSSENTVVVRAMPDDIALAQKLLNDLDHPKKTYRLIYTVTEMDGTKKISSQRFAMVLTDSQRTSLNQGSRVPLPTSTPVNGVSTQYTYVDVGTNFEATLYSSGSGAKLDSKVTQSSSVAATSGDAVQAPIMRNLTLEGSSMLVPGKPVALGSMDVPGSTRHLDVEVVMENLQ